MHMLARESEASTGMEPFKAGRPVNSFAEEGDGMACASKQRSARHMLHLWQQAHADAVANSPQDGKPSTAIDRGSSVLERRSSAQQGLQVPC